MNAQILQKYALVLVSAAMLLPSSVAGKAQLHTSAQANQMLEKAVASIGGQPRIDRVKTLLIEATRRGSDGVESPLMYRMMLPDRFQEVSSMTYTINGESYWQTPETTEQNRAMAKTAKTRTFVELALAMLLRSPALISVDAEAAGSTGLVFRWGDRTMNMEFDPATHRPISFSHQGRLIRDGVAEPVVRTVRLEDYRTVAGVAFPFRWRETFGSAEFTTQVSKLLVNSGVSPADFLVSRK